MIKLKSFLPPLVLGLMLTPLANAVPAVIFDDLMGSSSFSVPVTLGWQFTTNSAILVTDLGYFDDSQNGLLSSHDVGIFSDAGSLLVSVTVPAGGGSLINQFRYVAITPILLAAGQTFRIGGFSGSSSLDVVVHGNVATGFAADPAITFEGGGFASAAALADPTFVTGGNRSFGPNFNFVAAAAGAPELDSRSSGFALASLFVMLAVLQRRSRTSLTPTK